MNYTPVLANSRLRLRGRCAFGAILVVSLLVGKVAAQPTPAPAPPTTAAGAAGESDAIVLNPFSVSSERDVGYAAGDSLAASRFNTRLMDSASTISVFTEEFLKDLGASSL